MVDIEAPEGLEELEEHGGIPCVVCGCEATRYTTFMPICQNVVCYEVRNGEVLDAVRNLSKTVKGGRYE